MHALSSSVLIVAPPTLHRQGLVTMLRDFWPVVNIVLQPEAETLPQLLYHQSYAVVVLDSSLLTGSVPAFLRRLRAIRSAQPVLLLTGPRLPPDLREYLIHAATSAAWLPRHAAPTTATLVFRSYLTDVAALSPPPASSPRSLLTPTPFSRRELDVLRLVVNDCCNQEIADQLCLSVRTVESHRRALLQKAGARTLVGLVVQAMRQGWVGMVVGVVCC